MMPTAKLLLKPCHEEAPSRGACAAVKKSSRLSVEQFIQRISQDFGALSKQLKVIALYVERNRDRIGLEGVREISRQCGVQPSAIVRFAQHFGFSGYSELQGIFRESLARQIAPSHHYKVRVHKAQASCDTSLSATNIARQFLEGSAAGMLEMANNLDESAFEAAVDQLAQGDCIWIAAARRSFSIAAYLNYALQATDKRVILVNALGSMSQGQMRSVRPRDVVLAITFPPYADETLAVVKEAKARGAKVVLITDSRMIPLASLASVTLLVHDHTTLGFSSISPPMGLAQSLFIALAYKLDLPVISSNFSRDLPPLKSCK